MVIMDKAFIDRDLNYIIFKDGRVFSKKTNKFLNPYILNGYLTVSIRVAKEQKKNMRIHRLIAIAFIDNFDESKNTVNHIDGNKLNNDISNLEWCSSLENKLHYHKYTKNNIHDRTANGLSISYEDILADIKNLCVSKISTRFINKEYPVFSLQSIRKIRREC